jgi:acetyltransferase
MQSGQYKATLRDGTRCVIRLCCHNDSGEQQQHLKEGIRSAWCHLSPESRFYRFGYVPRQLSEQQLDYLANLDNHARLAWCAFVEDDTEQTGIGLARYVRIADEPGVAEFAITIVDEYQHQGLGRLLLQQLIESAGEARLKILRGYVHPGNRAMLSLAKQLGGESHTENDYVLVDIPVPQAHDLTGYQAPPGAQTQPH